MSSLWNDNVFGSNFKTRGQNGVHSYLVDKSRHLPDLKGGFKLQNSDFTLHSNESYFYTTNELRNVPTQLLPLNHTNILQPNSESYGMIAHLRLPSSAAVRVNGDGVPTQNDMSDSGIVPMNRMKYFPASYGKGDMSDVILPTQGDEYKTLEQYQSEMFDQYLKDQNIQNKRKPDRILGEDELGKLIVPDPAMVSVEEEMTKDFAEYAKQYSDALNNVDYKTLKRLSLQIEGLGDAALSESSKKILEDYVALFESKYDGELLLKDKMNIDRYQSPVEISYQKKLAGLPIKHTLISLQQMNAELIIDYDAIPTADKIELIKLLKSDGKDFVRDASGMLHVVTNLTNEDRTKVQDSFAGVDLTEKSTMLASLQIKGKKKYYEKLQEAKAIQFYQRAMYEYTTRVRGSIVPYVPLVDTIEAFRNPVKKSTSLIDEKNNLSIPSVPNTKSIDILNTTITQLTEAIKQLQIKNSYSSYQAEEEKEDLTEQPSPRQLSPARQPSPSPSQSEKSIVLSPPESKQGSRRSSVASVESKESGNSPPVKPMTPKTPMSPKTFYYDPKKPVPQSEKSKNAYADIKLRKLAARDLRESEVRQVFLSKGVDLVSLTDAQKKLLNPLITSLANGLHDSPSKIVGEFMEEVRSSTLTEQEKKSLDFFEISNAVRTYQLQTIDFTNTAGVPFKISSSSPEPIKQMPRKLLKRMLDDKQSARVKNQVSKIAIETEQKEVESKVPSQDIQEIKDIIEKLSDRFEQTFQNVRQYETLSKRMNILSSVQRENFKKVAGKLQEIRQSQSETDKKFTELLYRVNAAQQISTAEATAIYTQSKEIYSGLVTLTDKVYEIDNEMEQFASTLTELKINEELNKGNIELLLGQQDAEIARAQIEFMKYVVSSNNQLVSEYEEYAITEMTKQDVSFTKALDTSQFQSLVEYEDNLQKMDALYMFHEKYHGAINLEIDSLAAADMNENITFMELKSLKELTLPFFSATSADFFPANFTYQEATAFLNILKSYVDTAMEKTKDNILTNYAIPILSDVRRTNKYYGGPKGLSVREIRESFARLDQPQKDFIQNLCFKDFFECVQKTNFRNITDDTTYDVDQPGTLAVYYSFLFGRQAYDELVNSNKTFQHMCYVQHGQDEIKFDPNELQVLYEYTDGAKKSFGTDTLTNLQQLSTVIQFGGLTGDFRLAQLNGLHPDVLTKFLSNYNITREDCKLPYTEFYKKFVNEVFKTGSYNANSLALIDYTKTLLNEKTPMAQLLCTELEAAPKTMQAFFSCFESDPELYNKLANYFDHAEEQRANAQGTTVQFRTTLPYITFCQMANGDFVTFRKMIYDAAAEYKGRDTNVYNKLVNEFQLVEGFIGYPNILQLLLDGIEQSPDPKDGNYRAVRVKYLLNGQKVEATNALHIKDFNAPVLIKLPGPLAVFPNKSDGNLTRVALPVGAADRSSRIPTLTYTPTKKFTNANALISAVQVTPSPAIVQTPISSPGMALSIFNTPQSSIFVSPQPIPNILATTTSTTAVDTDVEMTEEKKVDPQPTIDPKYTQAMMTEYMKVFTSKAQDLIIKNITDPPDKIKVRVRGLANDFSIPVSDDDIEKTIEEYKTKFFKR